jgi:hypothetical protein
MAKYPCALDADDELVRIETVSEDDERIFKCIECSGRMVACARGSVHVTPYFRHVTDAASGHDPEGPAHATAKAILTRLDPRCFNPCTVKCEYDTGHLLLPRKWATAKAEYPLPGGGRADVAFLDTDGRILFVIEVYATHRTKEASREGLVWYEFGADDVIAHVRNNQVYLPLQCLRTGRCHCNRAPVGTPYTLCGGGRVMIVHPTGGRSFYDSGAALEPCIRCRTPTFPAPLCHQCQPIVEFKAWWRSKKCRRCGSYSHEAKFERPDGCTECDLRCPSCKTGRRGAFKYSVCYDCYRRQKRSRSDDH